MTISEVIKELERLREKHGDVRVDMHDEYDEFPVAGIYFDPDSSSYPPGDNQRIEKGSEFWNPDRIIFSPDESE